LILLLKTISIAAIVGTAVSPFCGIEDVTRKYGSGVNEKLYGAESELPLMSFRVGRIVNVYDCPIAQKTSDESA
jgi:hypothetical protein